MSSNSIVILKRIDIDPDTRRPVESIDSVLSTELNHQAASFTTPQWAEELPPTEFTTYWLY